MSKKDNFVNEFVEATNKAVCQGCKDKTDEKFRKSKLSDIDAEYIDYYGTKEDYERFFSEEAVQKRHESFMCFGRELGNLFSSEWKKRF